MPGAYVSVDEFRMRTVMPREQLDRLEARAPGWLEQQLESSSRWSDMWLAKRYPVPFRAPYPEAVKSWIVRMVTKRAYVQLGINATDEQQELISSDAEKAEAEIKQAADGQLGLIDLADSGQNRVTVGGTLAYSEGSPYVGSDARRERGHREDIRRRGT